MTNEEVDRILTEAKDECYHELDYAGALVRCDKCHLQSYREDIGKRGNFLTNPSPITNWSDYGEVLEWAKKQGWWEEFVLKGLHVEIPDGDFESEVSAMTLYIANTLTNPQTGSHALAEFLRERKELNDG